MRPLQSADSFAFDFVPTTGLNAARAKHMHGVTYTFIDANHLQMEGVAWKDGKTSPCGLPVFINRK